MQKNRKFLFPLILASSIIIPTTLVGCSNIPIPTPPTITIIGGSLNLVDKQFNAGIDNNQWKLSNGSLATQYSILPINQAAIDAGDKIYITSSGNVTGKVQWQNLDINTYEFQVVGDTYKSPTITLTIEEHKYDIIGYEKIEINNITIDETKELKYHYNNFGSQELKVTVDDNPSDNWSLQLGTSVDEQLLCLDAGLRFGSDLEHKNTLYWGSESGWNCKECIQTFKVKAIKDGKSFTKIFDLLMKTPPQATWHLPFTRNKAILFDNIPTQKIYVNKELILDEDWLSIFFDGQQSDINKFDSVLTYSKGGKSTQIIPTQQWENDLTSPDKPKVKLPAGAITFTEQEWDESKPEKFEIKFICRYEQNTYVTNLSQEINVMVVKHDVYIEGLGFILPHGAEQAIDGKEYSVKIDRQTVGDGNVAIITKVTCGNKDITSNCTIAKNSESDNTRWLNLTIPAVDVDDFITIYCGEYKKLNPINLIGPSGVILENTIKDQNILTGRDYDGIIKGLDKNRELVVNDVFVHTNESQVSILDQTSFLEVSDGKGNIDKHLIIDSNAIDLVSQISNDNTIYVDMKYISHHVRLSSDATAAGISFLQNKMIENGKDFINSLTCSDPNKKIIIKSVKWTKQIDEQKVTIENGENGYIFKENKLTIYKEAEADGNIEVDAYTQDKETEGIHNLNNFNLTLVKRPSYPANEQFRNENIYLVDAYGEQINLSDGNWECSRSISDYDWIRQTGGKLSENQFYTIIEDGHIVLHISDNAVTGYQEQPWQTKNFSLALTVKNKNNPSLQYTCRVTVGFILTW